MPVALEAVRFSIAALGAIINIASIVEIVPELLNGLYGGTKTFVIGFSRSLHKKFVASNIRVQVVLPVAIATAFWEIAGTPLEEVPREVMNAEEMVDSALFGFDQGELRTIPRCPTLPIGRPMSQPDRT